MRVIALISILAMLNIIIVMVIVRSANRSVANAKKQVVREVLNTYEKQMLYDDNEKLAAEVRKIMKERGL